MSIKERPLIKAIEKPGPLPGFLYDNPYVAGFVAVIMCPVFGAVFMLFWAGAFGGTDTLAIFKAVHQAAWIGLGLGALILLLAGGRMVYADDEDQDEEEKADYVKFLKGGLAGVVFFALADWAAYDPMERYFAEAGPIACASFVPRCD